MPQVVFLNLMNNAGLNRLPYGIFDNLLINFNNNYNPTQGINLDLNAKCSVLGFNINENNKLVRKLGEKYNYMSDCTYLDLSAYDLNLIEELAFFGLSNVTFLDLTQNNITEVPFSALDPLVSLQDEFLLIDEKTKCSSVSFSVINGVLTRHYYADPNYFAHCSTLNLVGGKVHDFETDVFVGMEKLKKLILSNNSITSIMKVLDVINIDSDTIILDSLKLDYNLISDLNNVSFVSQPQLRELYLNGNLLIVLKSTDLLFKSITSGFKNGGVYFQNNNISVLEPNCLRFVSDLGDAIVDLNNNPIECCGNNTKEIANLQNHSFHCYIENETKLSSNFTDVLLSCEALYSLGVENDNNNNNNNTTAIIVSCVVVAGIAVVLSVGLCVFFYKRKITKQDRLLS
eukprot:Pgem_evm2s3134